MWGVALIFIIVAHCNAELPKTKINITNNRIIGGSATTIEKYPFAVQVLYVSMYHCGGSLVTRQHVLSAAHCFINWELYHPENQSFFTIREGTTFLNDSGSVHEVKEIILHELYDLTYRDNDVAVVMMATRIDLTTSVARTVRIIKQGAMVPDNSSVTAIGWGTTNETILVLSPVLNEVKIRTINRKTCQNRYDKVSFRRITSSMICAGILDVGGKDTCYGDSGGALLHRGIVVGVVSWGISCAHPGSPGVYARVAKFTDWIKYTVKKSLQRNNVGNSTKPGNTSSLGSKVGDITLLTSVLLFLLLRLSI